MAKTPFPTHEDYLGIKFFPSLDGLRAIAVALVFSVHFGGTFGAAILGRLGVQVFFVLSGFLITTLLLRENVEHQGIDLRRFYVRRVFRIMPVYYFLLLLVVWQTRHLDDWWGPLKSALPYYLSFSGEVFFGQAPWQIVWSLGVEWKFYLVWPVLAFVIARSTKGRIAAATLVAVAGLLGWHLHFLLRDYIQLLYGALLAMLMHSERGFRYVVPLMRPRVALGVFAAFIFMQSVSGRALAFTDITRIENAYSFAVAVLLPAIITPQGLPYRVLSSRMFVFVGRRSYSMYLVQPFAQQAVAGIAPWHADNIWNVIQVFLVAVVFSDVIFRCVERPCIEIGSRLLKRWEKASGLQRDVQATQYVPRERF